MKRLYPISEIDGRGYLLATPLMSAVRASELRNPIANLSTDHDRIVAAVDFLHQGF